MRFLILASSSILGNPGHRRSRNENRYTLYNLPYEPINRGEGVLRPEIKIETAVWPLYEPAVILPVSSFIADAYQRPPELAAARCVTVAQTAAEKFVALTRRVAAETGLPASGRDPTLMRHIYDLHAMQEQCDLTLIAAMARRIMNADAVEFGNKSPAYRDDCVGETRRAFAALVEEPDYAKQYSQFSRDMVFGEAPDYETALRTPHHLLGKLPE